MPSPRIEEPSIPKDGRSVVVNQGFNDLFQTLAPTVVQVGSNYIGNEMEQRALADIQGSLAATKQQLLENTQAPRPPEVDSAVSDYAQRVSRINSAVDQGAIGKDTATTRVNALTREYSRRFPAFASEFTSRNSALEATVEQAFAADAQLAAASRRSEEDAAVRTAVAAHGFNPDNAADVQVYMNIKQQAFMDTVLEAKLKRDKAAKEIQDAQAAHNTQLWLSSNLLEEMTGWLKGYDEVLNRGGPAAAEQYFTQRQLDMAAKATAWFYEMEQRIPPGPEQDRVRAGFNDMLDRIEKAGDPTKLSAITSSLRDVMRQRSEIGFMASLSPAVRDLYSAFGPNFGQVIESVTNFVAKESTLRTRLGDAGYERMQAAFGEILGVSIGPNTQIPPNGLAVLQETTAAVAQGTARPSPQAAAAGVVLMEGRANMTPEQFNNAYSAVVDGGKTQPLHWFTRADNIPKVGFVQQNPRFQRQVAREVSLARQYFSRNPDARIQFREDAEGNPAWVIVDKGRVLLSSTPPVSPEGNMITQAWPNSVRDTLNAGSILGNAGYAFPDMDRLLSDLNPVVNPVKPANQSSQ